MNDLGKSDGCVVPAKLPNNTGVLVAEAVEGRRPAEGNAASKTRPGLRAGIGAPSALDRVRYRAQQDKGMQFTALLHVDLVRLRAAYWAINSRAASGVDDVTWSTYGQDLRKNLQDLHRRVHCGGYRAKPTRRAYIPKHDGRLRPLGIAALEDKILQRQSWRCSTASTRRTSLASHMGSGRVARRMMRSTRSPPGSMTGRSTGCSTRISATSWSHRHTANAFMGLVSNRLVSACGTSIRRPFRRPLRTWRACSSPRLTRCNTVWRETPRIRIASTIGT